MRILTIANHLASRGGLERTQLTNCEGLARRGHSVDVAFVSNGDFSSRWGRFADAMLEMAPTLPRRRVPLSAAGIARAAVSCALRRPDVVYAYRYLDVPFACIVKVLTGAPVVYHSCLPPPSTIPRWLPPFLRRVDATISVSTDTARRWSGLGLQKGRTRVIRTGIDLEEFSPHNGSRQAERSALGLQSSDFLVLYAGRIAPEKGLHVLVEAYRLLRSTVSSARLVVVGRPSLALSDHDSRRYSEELDRLADGLGVIWLPARPDIVELIRAADVAVVPSLWPEPLARSILEPIACGIPVVATDVGGTGEALCDWLAEYLVEPGDRAALSSRLASLADWRTSNPGLSARLRRHAEEHFSLPAELDGLESALLEIVGIRSRFGRVRRALSR